MKKYIFTVIIFFLTFILFAEEETYLDANNLKGGVRYIETYSADASLYFDEIKEENEVLAEKVILNENGRLTESLRYYKGKPTTYEKYWYQDDLLIKKLHRDEDGISTIIHEYNENADLLKLLETDENEELLNYSEYKYENQDQEKIMWIYNYSINNEILSATKYRLNKIGNPIEQISYDGDGEKESVHKYQYNENDNLLIQTTYNSEGLIDATWSEADNTQRLEIYDESGDISSTYIYILDEDRLLKEYKCAYSEDVSYLEGWDYKYEYDFDEQGNWINRTTYEAFEKYGEIIYEPIEIKSRKIIYQDIYSEIAIQPAEYSEIGMNIISEEDKSDFYVFEDVDPIDDVKTVFFMLDAYEGENEYGDKIGLVIRGEPDKAEVYIRWETYLGSDTIVTLRIDDNEAESKTWSISTNNESSFYPSNEIELIKELFNADKMVVRTTPYGDNTITATFDISGFYKEAEPYLEYLKWDE